MSAGAARRMRRLDVLLSCAELPEIPDLAWHIAEALTDLSRLELKDYEASLLRQMAYLQLQYRCLNDYVAHRAAPLFTEADSPLTPSSSSDRCAVLRPPTPEGGNDD